MDTNSTVAPTSLAVLTREALDHRPRSMTLARLAELADVSPRWLGYFAAGKISNPSIYRIERVYAALMQNDRA